MKKIGLLVLSLVVVLGTLGVGYSMWTQQVTINGTVNTGNIQLAIRDNGVTDPVHVAGGASGLDPLCSPSLANAVQKDVGNQVSTNIGSALPCTTGGVSWYSSIEEDINNAYPGYNPGFIVQVTNCGSVPVAISNIVARYTGAPAGCTSGAQDLVPWMTFSGSWTLKDNNGVTQGSGTFTPGTINSIGSQLGVVQIDTNWILTVTLNICFAETNAQGTIMPQSACAAYTVTVTAANWNEVPGG